MSVRVPLRRAIGGLLAAACLAAASACGSEGDGAAKPPPGSPDNPLPAQSDETAATAETRGFDELLEQQREAPRERDAANVCGLVTKAQAETISGAPLRDPFLAPQGPTCIYRDRAGTSFATVAIQPVHFATLRRQMDDVRRVEVSKRSGFCGVHGRPVLYVPLAQGRVLSIAAECGDALRLARFAAPRLPR